tara:strand:- start:7 stop:726 length:720 start_codon:yes stop_codon:yes gene_type:complete
MHKSILLSLTLFSFLATSCNEKINKVHAIFVDTTASTSTLKNDNPVRIIKHIESMLLNKVKSGETVIIYPIHSQTASASPIGEWMVPNNKGDMGDEKRKKQAVKNIIVEIKKVLFDESPISQTVRSSTSIFPIFNKIKRLSNKGIVEITVFSDMLEDNSSMSFTDLFSAMNKKQIKSLAAMQYNKRSDEISIIGTNIRIFYPSTVLGDPNIEKIMNKVDIFWEAFFAEAGANIFISDLS